ncbi:MAG: hypothetical protein U0990_06655 [Candidatus Nanopelagicales bacterium]|nr:hypothetical protein [Candidatus Nanopelagicales bacterium]MDZ4249755.1 hypothetical protein [Candidatus Nanopelagicales bacterium]
MTTTADERRLRKAIAVMAAIMMLAGAAMLTAAATMRGQNAADSATVPSYAGPDLVDQLSPANTSTSRAGKGTNQSDDTAEPGNQGDPGAPQPEPDPEPGDPEPGDPEPGDPEPDPFPFPSFDPQLNLDDIQMPPVPPADECPLPWPWAC